MSRVRRRECRLRDGGRVVIRSAAPGDALSLVAIKKSVVEEGDWTVVQADEFETSGEAEQESIRRHTERPGYLYLVADVEGEPVGLLEFENGEHERSAHSGMLSMFVGRGWRDRGVGTVLLQVLIDWATENPIIEKLTLAVFHTNARAIALYRKLGFEQEGYCPRDMKAEDGTYIDSVLMYRFVAG